MAHLEFNCWIYDGLKKSSLATHYLQSFLNNELSIMNKKICFSKQKLIICDFFGKQLFTVEEQENYGNFNQDRKTKIFLVISKNLVLS